MGDEAGARAPRSLDSGGGRGRALRHTDEDGDDHVITLFYRPWDGKEWREIFTTENLAGYLKEGWFSSELKVQSFAVRPGWNGGAQ